VSGARLVLLALAALVPLVQQRIDARLSTHRAQQEVLYLWSSEHVRKLYPGFENLMADVYWLRTIQYFGGQRVWSAEKRFDVLEPLIDVTVTLDPRFEIAYRYGATFLSEPWPIGADQPEAGVRLLERGVTALPRSWLLWQTLGFFTYFHLGDARRAAEAMLEGAKLPGAPSWFETMAADFLSRGGDRATARKLWTRLLEQSEEGQLRRNALAHLERLDAEELMEKLAELIRSFEQRFGRKPVTLQELVSAGIARLVPVDPAGTPFVYDRVSGSVEIARQSRLWRSPIKPRSRG
jgi:hypothetical protein